MIQNVMTVFSQVLVLFLLACTGYLCGKLKLLTEEVSKGLAALCLYVVAPCLMISSFQCEFEPQKLRNFLCTFLISLAVQGFCILFTKLVIRDGNLSRRKVLRSTVIFSNCGMISLALQNSLFGADGVFYGAAYIAGFNLVFWTYGVLLLGRREDVSAKKIFLNPGIIGTVIGLMFFFTSIKLPMPLKAACDHISNLNTPLSMLVIGQQISAQSLKTMFSDRGAAKAVVLRLAVIPLLAVGSLRLLKADTMVALVCVIAASAPAASANTMLALNLGQDSALSVKIVSMGTLLSMFSMPLLIVLAQAVL